MDSQIHIKRFDRQSPSLSHYNVTDRMSRHVIQMEHQTTELNDDSEFLIHLTIQDTERLFHISLKKSYPSWQCRGSIIWEHARTSLITHFQVFLCEPTSFTERVSLTSVKWGTGSKVTRTETWWAKINYWNSCLPCELNHIPFLFILFLSFPPISPFWLSTTCMTLAGGFCHVSIHCRLAWSWIVGLDFHRAPKVS